MKIGILNAYQGKVERGAETFVKELSEKLALNHDVEIMTDNAQPLPRWKFLWRLFIDPSGLFICWFTLKNIKKILFKKYDVVIPLNGGWQPALVRLATWLYGGKMVISGQSGPGWDDINNLWCFPDSFVSLSSFSNSWAKKINPFVKVVTIPNGVNLEKFKPGNKKVNLNLQKPIILCVAALTPSKRIGLVINAISRLKSGSLLVVGKGEMKDRINLLGEKLLNGRFSLKEYPYQKIPDVYRSCDLFTLASEGYHSFEIVLLEAMATNLGVVANNDPIRTNIIGEAGYTVNPENSEEYAKALKKALQNDWQDIPRKQAENYSWDKISKEYEGLFYNLRGK